MEVRPTILSLLMSMLLLLSLIANCHFELKCYDGQFQALYKESGVIPTLSSTKIYVWQNLSGFGRGMLRKMWVSFSLHSGFIHLKWYSVIYVVDAIPSFMSCWAWVPNTECKKVIEDSRIIWQEQSLQGILRRDL